MIFLKLDSWAANEHIDSSACMTSMAPIKYQPLTSITLWHCLTSMLIRNLLLLVIHSYPGLPIAIYLSLLS